MTKPKVNITIEPFVLRDLRLTFDAHRRRYLAGEIPKKWKPTYDFYNMENLDQLLADLKARLTFLTENAAANVDIPELETVNLRMPRTGDILYRSQGNYYLFDSTDTAAAIALPKGYTLADLYTSFPHFGKINGNPLKSASERRESGEREVLSVLEHELRHHQDRRSLTQGYGLQSILSKKMKDQGVVVDEREIFRHPTRERETLSEHTIDGDLRTRTRSGFISNVLQNPLVYLFSKIFYMRKEGFARFEGSLPIVPSDIGKFLAIKVDRSDNPSREELNRRYDAYWEAQNKLLAEDFMQRTTKAGQKMAAAEDLLSGKIGYREFFLTFPDGLPGNGYGDIIFETLAYDAVKRQLELKGKSTAPADIYASRGELPQHFAGEIANLVYFKDFFDRYHSAAANIGLTDSQLVIPKGLAGRIAEFESKNQEIIESEMRTERLKHNFYVSKGK